MKQGRKGLVDLSGPGRILSRLLVIWALIFPALAAGTTENRGQRSEPAAQGLVQAGLMGPAVQPSPQRAKASEATLDDAPLPARVLPDLFVPVSAAAVPPRIAQVMSGRVNPTALPRGPPAV
jgi:hypothetical protein